MQGLHLFFTPDGIRAELATGADEQAVRWADRWSNDPYGAIYDYGLLAQEDPSAVGSYVHTLVRLFWRKLTDLPELEMLRGTVGDTFSLILL